MELVVPQSIIKLVDCTEGTGKLYVIYERVEENIHTLWATYIIHCITVRAGSCCR